MKNLNKGFALLVCLVILAAFLALALVLTTIFWKELVSATAVSQSAKAIYIADAGIERTLVFRNNPAGIPFTNCQCAVGFCSLPETGGSFCYEIRQSGIGNCTADYYCIKVIGDFAITRRSIEVSY